MSFTTISASDLRSAFPAVYNENLRRARHLNISAKSATFTVWADDAAGSPKDFYPCDATSGAITANLPAAADADVGRPVCVMKIDGSGNAVTLDGDGSETINGATTKALASQYDYAWVVCDGTEWWVIG